MSSFASAKSAPSRSAVVLSVGGNVSRPRLNTAIAGAGCTVQYVNNGAEALAYLTKQAGGRVFLVVVDPDLPFEKAELAELRRRFPDLPVLMALPHGLEHTTPECRRPLNTVPPTHARPGSATDSKGGPDRQEPADGFGQVVFDLGVGWSSEITPVLEQVAVADTPVLLLGETGTGKEVLCRYLHAHSSRAGRPFLKVNCAALPSELVESELFGYERGAFTGAFGAKPGKFELASGGTILLDEIGDMPFTLQAKLLQVLQDHTFDRLGGKQPRHVDVRIMAATHCDLEAAVRGRRFRQDLFYRLNVITIRVPPLRERRDEILPLSDALLRRYSGDIATLPELPDSLKDAFTAHDWPGNVRELENVIRRLLVLRNPQLIESELRLCRSLPAEQPADTPLYAPGPDEAQTGEPTANTLEHVELANRQTEARAIRAALDAVHWNRRRAASLLQISYKTLLYRMRKHGIAVRTDGMAATPAPPSNQGGRVPRSTRLDGTAAAESACGAGQSPESGNGTSNGNRRVQHSTASNPTATR